MGVRHDQGVGGQATDILFAFEHQLGVPTAGFNAPHTGGGKAAHAQQAENLGQKLSALQSQLYARTLGFGDGVELVNPQNFSSLAAHDGNAFAGRRNGKRAHGHHTFVHRAIVQAQHPLAHGILLQLKRLPARLLAAGQRPPLQRRSGDISGMTHASSLLVRPSPSMASWSAWACRAWASYKRQ